MSRALAWLDAAPPPVRTTENDSGVSRPPPPPPPTPPPPPATEPPRGVTTDNSTSSRGSAQASNWRPSLWVTNASDQTRFNDVPNEPSSSSTAVGEPRNQDAWQRDVVAQGASGGQAPREVQLSEFLSAIPTWDYPPRVTRIIDEIYKAARDVEGVIIYAFGSAVNGFGDESSDIDVVLTAPVERLKIGLALGSVKSRDVPARSLATLTWYLRKVGFYIEEKILSCKVPILKLKYDDIDCDLSCNNVLPVFNTRLLKAYADTNARVVALQQEVKRWAKENGVHGAPEGHLSSYSFTLMSIFYMQIRGALPNLQSRAAQYPEIYKEGGHEYNVAMDAFDRYFSGRSVDVDFQDFVRFYVEEFSWGESVVSVRVGRMLTISSFPELNKKILDRLSLREGRQVLHIEDPIDITRNTNIIFSPGHINKLWWALKDALKSAESSSSRPSPSRDSYKGFDRSLRWSPEPSQTDAYEDEHDRTQGRWQRHRKAHGGGSKSGASEWQSFYDSQRD